jgi:phosphate transport system substrate-binding protein
MEVKMKKPIILISLVILAFGFVVCDNPAEYTPAKDKNLTVTFNSNDGSNVQAITGITSGSTIALPTEPTKDGYIFSGWFIDDNTFLNEFTLSTPVTQNITVYAKWTEPMGIEGISFENYPIVDGSTSSNILNTIVACKLLGIRYEWSRPYAGIETSIHPKWEDLPEQYKQFFHTRVMTSQTHGAFINLIDGNADIIVNHRTISPDEKAYADAAGVTLIETSIALDPFIFIVNKYNPVRSLTVNQIQKIYTGEITNWSEVGGSNAAMRVFTRPRNSGSEEVFRILVMDGLEPAVFPEVPLSTMWGVFVEVMTVTEGICYIFDAYKEVQARMPDSEVPKIAINDIFPTESTVKNRSYPFIAEVHIAIRSDLDRNSMAYKLYEWMQTDNIKPIITECGFITLEPENGNGATSDFLFNSATGTITKYTGNGSAVTIPSSIDGVTVTAIGNDTFSYCTSLTSATIPNSVTSIGVQAFMNCIRLTSITIPSSVRNIGDSAFMNCTSLADVTIPDSVTTIGSDAFRNCTSLAGVTIPNSVRNIGARAFYRCASLANVTIGNGNTTIEMSAFNSCASLASVTFLGTNTAISSYDAFPGDLRTVYLSPGGGIGMYTRTGTPLGTEWTKQS